MEKRLLILGAGGLAAEVEEIARLSGYEVVGFLDDCPEKARCTPVLGGMSSPENYREVADAVAVAIGNNKVRLSLCDTWQEAGFSLPVLVHPGATVSPDARLGEGCILRAGAVISRNVRLGEGCLVNLGVLIDHDCVAGDGVHLGMGCILRGDAHIPALTHIPPGSVVEETRPME